MTEDAIVIEHGDVDAPESYALLRDYFGEILGRIHDREVTPAAIDRILAEESSDALRPPSGAFLLARSVDGLLIGCVGVREIADGIGEIKRMFVAQVARGTGLGSQLLSAAEAEGLRLGWTEMRLDTRSELDEARALYERRGYVEVPAYNDNPHAQHWYTKPLAG